MKRLPSPLTVLALVALLLAGYHYFSGEDLTLPLQQVAHLQPQPLALEQVTVGPVRLPLEVNGYFTTLTHNLGGPYTRPDAAALWLGLLAVVLAGWLAVVSTLPRPAFVAGMALVIFFLMSLNADLLGIFNESRQYFLMLTLGLLGGTAFGLHTFGERVPLRWRWLLFGALVAWLSWLLFNRSLLTTEETLLHLAAYATPGSAAAFLLLVLWLGFENVHGLLWLNTQARQPSGRYGVGVLLFASLLYLGLPGWYWWSDGELMLFPGWHFDPLLLLLPAALVAGLGLPRRSRITEDLVPYEAARQLYPLLLTVAAGAIGYGLATANGPLLRGAREFTALALFGLGGAFLLYLLLNFWPLLRQRLQVYKVVFEPRRFPYYAMYTLGVLIVLGVETQSHFPVLDHVQAGMYNLLGDLSRQQSEQAPDDFSLALLAERYYAESDALDFHNHHASLGRAALYRFQGQLNNEINALTRALQRTPSEKISLHLASLYADPKDFFSALQVYRQGLRQHPRSAPLAADLAQLYTRSALTDSVAFYMDKAERLAPGDAAGRANQLAFLLQQQSYEAAQKLAADQPREPGAAWQSNVQLGRLLRPGFPAPTPGSPEKAGTLLPTPAHFAQLYHSVLRRVQAQQPVDSVALRRVASNAANGSYADQLAYLRALSAHAAGQELRARQLLAPLAAGTSAGPAYYQYVLSLWQLQQGQYATAAEQLARAVAHGLPTARAARAYALALAGAPDSARAVAARLATDADATERQRGQQLQQLLPRLGAGRLNARLDSLLRQGSADALRQYLRQLPASPATTPAGARRVVEARLAELSKQPAVAAKQYAAVVAEAPFNETAVLAVARFHSRQHDELSAYDALRQGLDENPQSLELLRSYVLAAINAGLGDYATEALGRLQPRLSPADYATLQAQFAAARAARAAREAAFKP